MTARFLSKKPLLLSLGVALLTIVASPASLQPNIIVIISDDAGYADFGFMNAHSGSASEIPTPHLDSLAARGITFSRAYVAANCQPTRAAIVTGAYQARIGNENVGNNNFRNDQLFEGLPVETDTIWDRMRKLGYTTGAIGKWHLGSLEDTLTRPGNRPQNQGIDRFFGFWHGSREFTAGHYKDHSDNPDHPLQLRYLREAINHPDGSKTDVIKEYTDYANVPSAEKDLTKILGNYAEQFIADHHDDSKPFFLYLAHPAPHKPWTNHSPDYHDPRIKNLAPNNRRQVASMMITMDKEIGDLMAKLDDPNGDGDSSDSITDNTLVIFLNDNGGVSGKENGVNGTSNGILNGFKGSAHDGGIRVPMIMAGAGIEPSKIGTVFDKPVHGIDLLPTSVALAGGNIAHSEKIDGVNLLPYLNGENSNLPHETLVHRWRGTFAVIQGNWKLVNTRNTNASPGFYKLHNLTTDPGEENDLSKTNPARVKKMIREVTHMEAKWDKPRYPILNRTLETEPLNLIDHFTFRPGLHHDWSAGAPEQASSSDSPQNWFEGGTTNPENLLRSDGFPGAILEFPAHSSDYTSNNDLRRKTGLEFMLNKIILSGNDTSNHSATITGLPLIFTNNLAENPATIATNATGNFTYDLKLDLILYHDLTLTGNGTASLKIDGHISQFDQKRGLKKTGTSNAQINGTRTYSGDTEVLGGTLKVAQINPADENATYRLAHGATLNLAFEGTDTIGKLFLDGIPQPAGIYGSETEGITGTGTLTVGPNPGVTFPASDPENLGGWNLIESVSDEFEGDSLDFKKWQNLGLNGNYHGEWKGRAPSQYNPANVSVEGGFLTIASKWEPDFKFSDSLFNGRPYGKPAPVTTAAIVTKAKFKYGYLEIRCKAADGPVSSSFWTTGKDGELDVFEHFGANPENPNSAYRYHTSFHDWRKGSPTFGKRIWENDHHLGFKVAADFHTYGLDWTPDRLSIYIDGRLIRTVPKIELGNKWIATNEQKIWIDSETFDWELAPEKLTKEAFSKNPKFVIDYCRVWQRSKPATKPPTLPNLFGNQGFEEDLKYWVGEGEITDDSFLGKSAAKLNKSGKIQQTVNVQPNTTYILSAWAKLPGTDMKDAWTDAYLNVASKGTPRRSVKFFKPNFHRKSLEFTTGPDAEKATFWITNSPGSHPVVVDHFELRTTKKAHQK